jgi:hypothetical protein
VPTCRQRFTKRRRRHHCRFCGLCALPPPRVRSQCRCVQPFIHFVTDSLRNSVSLFLKRRCNRDLFSLAGGGGRCVCKACSNRKVVADDELGTAAWMQVSRSLSLFLCLCGIDAGVLCLPVPVCIGLSLSIALSVSLSPCLPVSMFLSRSVSVPLAGIGLSLCLSFCLSCSVSFSACNLVVDARCITAMRC